MGEIRIFLIVLPIGIAYWPYCSLVEPIGPVIPVLAPDRTGASSAAGSWAGPGPGLDWLGLKCYLAWGGTRVVGWGRGGKGSILYQFSEKNT